MRILLAVVVMMMAAGCGVPMTADGGVARLVAVRPVEVTLTSNGLQFSQRREAAVQLWSDQGKSGALTEDAERFQLFEVPEGPALFEYSRDRFLYTAKERLEPCEPRVVGGVAPAGAALEVNVTLTQPAAAGDSLQLVSSSLSWVSQGIDLEAGGTGVAVGRSWQGRRPLAGSVSVLHRVLGPRAGDFYRTTTVGILDAGVLDQLSAPSVLVQGSFEPVPAGFELLIPWDGASLAPLERDQAVVAQVEYTALRSGLPLATLFTRERVNTSVPLLMPALEADSFTVSGGVLKQLDPQHLAYASFSWHGPLGGSPELKLRHQPPSEVSIAPDAHAVAWLAPPDSPDVYVLQLLKPVGTDPSVISSELLATIITDETLVPLPAELRTPGMFALVRAISGEGLSASTCVSHFERLSAWAELPGFSARWNP